MTSLTFDLTPDQEDLPKNRKNPFMGKKKVRTHHESFKRTIFRLLIDR